MTDPWYFETDVSPAESTGILGAAHEPGRIRAPWTDEQVASLEAWQAGPMHPFTCPRGHGSLIATAAGWRCHWCTYEQDWAHDFMATEAPLPVAASWRQARPDETPGQVEPDDGRPQPLDLAGTGALEAAIEAANVARYGHHVTTVYSVMVRPVRCSCDCGDSGEGKLEMFHRHLDEVAIRAAAPIIERAALELAAAFYDQRAVDLRALATTNDTLFAAMRQEHIAAELRAMANGEDPDEADADRQAVDPDGE